MGIEALDLVQDESEAFVQAGASIVLPPNLGGEKNRIRAIVQGNFTIGGGNNFNTPLESAAQERITETVNVLKSSASIISQAAGLSNISEALRGFGQIQLKNITQTTNFWTGSRRPRFTLTLLFVALKIGDDVRKDVQILYRTVFPTRTARGLLVQAPLGYDGENNGKFAIQLGTWFAARNLVMRDVNFTFSQKQVPLDYSTVRGESFNFSPLFATGAIEFEPYRDVTYDEFLDYFPGVS